MNKHEKYVTFVVLHFKNIRYDTLLTKPLQSL